MSRQNVAPGAGGESGSEAEAPAQSGRTGGRRRGLLWELLDWLKYIAIAVVMGLLLTHFVVQRNEIVGVSMYPTLHNADQVITQKLSRYWDGLSYGDIVTVHGSKVPGARGTLNEDIVKRLIGRPGDRIEIKDGQVWRNGTAVAEDYLPAGLVTDPLNPEWSDVTLGADEYYVLGDNRPQSRDSRDFGPVPRAAFSGEVWIRIWPWASRGHID